MIWCYFLLLLSPAEDVPTADEILARIDKNGKAENHVSTSRMIVHGRRASRTITSKSWISNKEQSFTEYLAPPREKGIKMLKLADRLWTYTPSSDRIIRISGHLLRHSLMGSDLSYEDMMETDELALVYSARVSGEEIFRDRLCWVLTLISRQEDVAYHKRIIRVDKERFIVLQEERFAKSGKLLKTTEIIEVMRVGSRWVPKHIIFRDVLKKGKGTEFIIDEIEYNVSIPDHLFSKAALRK